MPVDVGLAAAAVGRLPAALAGNGWDLVEVPPADDCPDAVFVEDTVVMYRNVAVVTRPGADARKPEIVEVEKVVESLGCSIEPHPRAGTLDGGDVLEVGDTVYVGRGGRTNGEGIAQLRSILEPLGATVVAVPLTKVLHLKSAVTALPDGTVIGYPPVVDDPATRSTASGGARGERRHVVLLGGDKLLMAADAPQRRAVRRPRLRPRRRRHQRVREARGLRDLPLRPPPPPGALGHDQDLAVLPRGRQGVERPGHAVEADLAGDHGPTSISPSAIERRLAANSMGS